MLPEMHVAPFRAGAGQNGGMSEKTEAPVLSRGARYASVGAVWAVALVFAVLIGVLSRPAAYASWLSLALAVCVLLGFVAQLATQQKEGFVNRLAATFTGCFLVLGVTGGVLALVVAAG